MMDQVFRARGWFEEPKKDLSHGFGTQNLLKVTPHAGRKPYNSIFDWGAYFPFVAQSIRTKKYTYPQVSDSVQKDPVFQLAIKQAADQILREQKKSKNDSSNRRITSNISEGENGECITRNEICYESAFKRQEKRAYNILMDMRSTLNNFLLAFTSWLLYKLFPCFLSGVVTHPQQIDMLKAASQRAPGVPLIFLPLHRSHLDYIMVTFILTNNDIRSPLVAAGNNLQIPIFGGLLRGLGAFFIKRKIDPVGKKDILYRTVLHLYLKHALQLGHNVEFFIEGGRTRTGKPCMPKNGILSIIVNAFMDRSIEDALLVPVSVNYERLVDGNFIREQKGEKKVPESFGKAISGIWKVLNSRYGIMRIDFNEPYSIRELVQSYNKIAKEDGTMKIYKPNSRPLQHNQSTSSLYGTDVVCEEHRTLIESISRQVVYDCAAATSVMSTNALAFLLLTHFRNGASIDEIAKALDRLREILKGKRDLGFSGDSAQIISYACDLLGKDLVVCTDDGNKQKIIKPNSSIESVIELAYYSNMLTPHFALESILLTSFHSMLVNCTTINPNWVGKEGTGVPRKRLIELAIENCDIWRYECILNKPTQILENLLETTLDELIFKGLVKLAENAENADTNAENRKISQRIASYLEEPDDYDDVDENPNGITISEEADIFFAEDTINEQKAICDVLAPFAHTYLMTARSLQILYKNSILESEFIKFVINDITNKVNSGSCPYAESISTDSVRNCLKLLEKWSVIHICNQHGLRLITLGSIYESRSSDIKSIVDRILSIVPNLKAKSYKQ